MQSDNAAAKTKLVHRDELIIFILYNEFFS